MWNKNISVHRRKNPLRTGSFIHYSILNNLNKMTQLLLPLTRAMCICPLWKEHTHQTQMKNFKESEKNKKKEKQYWMTSESLYTATSNPRSYGVFSRSRLSSFVWFLFMYSLSIFFVFFFLDLLEIKKNQSVQL